MDVIALLLIGLGASIAVSAFIRAAIAVAAHDAPDELLGTDVEARRLDDLAVRKTALVAAIRTTELDFETGKVSQADRDKTLRRLENEAVTVMRTMDEIRGAEVDRDAAEREIAEFVAKRLGAADDGEAWSGAARMRHGGRAPTSGVTP